MKRNNHIRNKNGITLVVLIITIVILLIVIGVVIRIVMNENVLGFGKETVDNANEQVAGQKEEEENLKVEWDNLPGTRIKSPTN